MTHYLMVIDVWSNVTFVGPFDSHQAATDYGADCVNPEFQKLAITDDELKTNMQEYGVSPIQRPEER